MKTKSFYIIKYYKSIFSIIFVLIMSLMPGDNLEEVPKFEIPHLDKIVHFIMYFILSTAVIIDLLNNTNIPKRKIYIFSFISILIFSGCIEIIQELYIEKRGGDFLDLLANSTGIISSIILINSRVGEKFVKKWFIE